jgi:LmbE family N-acetylglucosaminyl deacetylase
MKRVLIVAAHPDDEVLGCGGVISKYRPNGVEFKIVFIGEGSTCRFSSPTEEAALAAIKHRAVSAVRAMECLGVKDFEFHDLPCGKLDQVPLLVINKIIELAILHFNPDTVFTHSPCDVNNDHKIIYNATIIATRPGAQNHVSRVLSYEVLSSTEWAFRETFSPNHFEELDEKHLAHKCQALMIYESETRDYPFPRSNEAIRVLAMMRGVQSGFAYAESFMLVREFKR